MSVLDAENWVLVGDTDIDQYTQPQIETCKKMNLNLKGVILCNDENQKNTNACFQVPAFPAFCNLESKICLSGLRQTEEEIADLQYKSNMHKSSSK